MAPAPSAPNPARPHRASGAAGHRRQDRMRGGADDEHQLAVMLISRLLFRLFSLLECVGPEDEVATGMVGIKPAGISRGVLDRLAAIADALNRIVNQFTNMLLLQQPSARFLQRRIVRDGFEADDLSQIRAVEQQLADAAIVLLLKVLEHQAGKQLTSTSSVESRLRELVRTVDVRIIAEGLLAGLERHRSHRPWRLAADHPTSNTKAGSSGLSGRFLQSRSGQLKYQELSFRIQGFQSVKGFLFLIRNNAGTKPRPERAQNAGDGGGDFRLDRSRAEVEKLQSLASQIASSGSAIGRVPSE